MSILKEGYSLPFKVRPPLSRSPVIVSGYANPVRNKHLKESLQVIEKVVVPSSLAFYNRLFLVPKPNNKWRPILDLSQLNLYLASASFKMETPETNRLSLQQGEWVTSLDFSDAYFHVPISQRSRKFLRFHLNSQTYQFTALPFGLPTTYPDPLRPMSRSRVGSQSFKVRTGSTTGFQLCRLSFRPLSRSGQTHSGEVDSSVPKNQSSFGTGDLLGQAVHVPNRTFDSHRKASGIGTPAHEAYSMAFKEALACPRSPGKDHSPAKVSPCSSEVVVRPQQGSERSTFTPLMTRPPTVYRRLKRRLGRILRRLHCKRPLVQTRRRLAHKFARTQSSFVGPKTVRAFVLEPDHPSLHRQHNSGFLHQQGGGYEIRLSLYPPLETPVMVQPETNCVTGQTHSGPPECHCRQTVQTQTGDSDRVVSPSRGFRPTLPETAQTGGGSFCNQIQSQTSQVCIVSTRPVGLEGRCINSSVGEPGRLCLSSRSNSGTGGHQTVGPRMSPNHPDCTRMAQHGMVLGPSQHVSSNSPLTSQGGEFANSTVQSVSAQRSPQPKSACLAPRATAIQQAGFSDEVARIEAPQRRSTRAVYKSKWTVFVRWCEENKVDFRSPSIKQIADFLLYLFQEKLLNLALLMAIGLL